MRVRGRRLSQRGEQAGAQLAAARDKVFALQFAQDGEGRGATERISKERARVWRFGGLGPPGVHYRRPSRDDADRDAAAQRLARAEQVGNGGAVCPHLPGASEAGVHLVGDKQQVERPARIAQSRKKPIRWEDIALATLARFHDDAAGWTAG